MAALVEDDELDDLDAILDAAPVGDDDDAAAPAAQAPTAVRTDYAKWDKLAKDVDDEEEAAAAEDPDRFYSDQRARRAEALRETVSPTDTMPRRGGVDTPRVLGGISPRPRVPRGYSEDGSRPRRGCHVDIPRTGRGAAAGASWIFRGRIAAPPRVPRGYSEAGSRRRRGCLADIPRTGRGAAAGASWIGRGRGASVGGGRARPRPRAG